MPQWPAPAAVKALSTTRIGGCSQVPYDGFNLAEHVGDDQAAVAKNRYLLTEQLPAEPVWLKQVHSNRVVDAAAAQTNCVADGSYTTQSKIVSVVMTADCLPVLACNRHGTGVAALHAGWRGLAEGIIEQGIEKLMQTTRSHPEDMLIWLGPAIGPKVFEVGEEVREQFMRHNQTSKHSFIPAASPDKWLADVYKLAKLRLAQLGVENIYGGDYCTYSQAERFFSYRRNGITGRMASMIWFVSTEY